MTDVFINNLILSGVFVRGVVLIVLIGMMFAEFIKRDKKAKTAILYFIVAFIAYFGILMMDIFSPVFIFDELLKAFIYLLLDFITATSFVFGLYQYWHVINTKYFVLMIFSVSFVIALEVLFAFYVNLILAIIYLVLVSLSILFFYFLAINFLININKTTENKKLLQPSKKISKKLIVYLLLFLLVVMFIGVVVRLIIVY
jgi:hypothetical protein